MTDDEVETSEPVVIDDFHRHQVLHMSSVIGDLFDKEILEQDFVQYDAELKAAADEISEKIGSFYQLVGNKIS